MAFFHQLLQHISLCFEQTIPYLKSSFSISTQKHFFRKTQRLHDYCLSKGYLEGQFHEKLIIVLQKWYLEEQFYEKIELSIKSVI